MASKLEETLEHRQAVRGDYERRMRDQLAIIDACGLQSSRRVLTLLFTQWVEAHEQCNEAARELSESVEAEKVVTLPVETFRGKAVAV